MFGRTGLGCSTPFAIVVAPTSNRRRRRMICDELLEALTHRVTIRRSGETYVTVRPGLGFAMYYAQPAHEMTVSIERIVDAYLRFVPEGAITALCGRDEWGCFSRKR